MKRYLLSLAVLTTATLFGAETPLINLVPAESKVIGGVHVDRTVNSPFGLYVLSQMNESEKELREFIAATGFDPRRDLREIVFASSAEQKGPGVVIARGVFNGPQILQAISAKESGTSIRTYKGIQVLDMKNAHSLAILDGSLAVAGNTPLVEASLDRRAGATASQLGAKASAASAKYDAWMVTSGIFVAPLPNAKGTGAQGPNLQGILETSGGLTFGSMIQFNGEAITRSDKDAQSLVDIVRFIAGMIQMNSGRNPEMDKLQPVFESLTVNAESNVVKLSFSIPEVDLERIAPMKKKAGTRASRQ